MGRRRGADRTAAGVPCGADRADLRAVESVVKYRFQPERGSACRGAPREKVELCATEATFHRSRQARRAQQVRLETPRRLLERGEARCPRACHRPIPGRDGAPRCGATRRRSHGSSRPRRRSRAGGSCPASRRSSGRLFAHCSTGRASGEPCRPEAVALKNACELRDVVVGRSLQRRYERQRSAGRRVLAGSASRDGGVEVRRWSRRSRERRRRPDARSAERVVLVRLQQLQETSPARSARDRRSRRGTACPSGLP